MGNVLRWECQETTHTVHWLLIMQKSQTVFLICLLFLPLSHCKYISGCNNHNRDGLYHYATVAPCKGTWEGHVKDAGSICSPGWHICSWRDGEKLKKVTMDDAMSVHGCYVYNAEQMHGQCIECSRNSISGNLAGIGRGCSEKVWDMGACITGGTIHAGLGHNMVHPCSYDAKLMDGVLCCRQPSEKPRITITPPVQVTTRSSMMFLLPCTATGSPPPHILWYKDGHLLRNNHTRMTLLSTGDLLVSLAHPTDSGTYTCEAVNDYGMMAAVTHVTVSDHQSGCSDRSTEELSNHDDVHACQGRWRGHVKRAWRLCARGWSVCSPRNEPTLHEIGWNEVIGIDGCYAYNAANTWGRCTKCSSRKMAGVGRDCGRQRLHKTSCLAQGRVDVFWPRQYSSCRYQHGLTTGVLCCRKKRRSSIVKTKECEPTCKNGGICVAGQRCHCLQGYTGTYCQMPVCKPTCVLGSVCIRPNRCKCKRGKYNRLCRKWLSRRKASNRLIYTSSLSKNQIKSKNKNRRSKLPQLKKQTTQNKYSKKPHKQITLYEIHHKASNQNSEKTLRNNYIPHLYIKKWSLKDVSETDGIKNSRCERPCRSGGRCVHGKCWCRTNYFGTYCQHKLWNSKRSKLLR